MSAVRNGAGVLTKRRVPQNTRRRYFLIYANLRPNNNTQYQPPKRVNLRRHFSGKQKVVRSANAVSETPLEKRSGARKTAGKLLVVAVGKEGAFSSCSASRRDRSASAHRARTSLERRFERRLERPPPSRVLDASSRRPREPRILESSPRARWRPGFPKETSGRFPTRPRLHRAGRLFPRAVTSARARARPA